MMSGYVEAVEILGDIVPIYFGGGGQPTNRVVEVEVYTSGNNGISFFSKILRGFYHSFITM